MSSDTQFTALGPIEVGFQTDSTNINFGAFVQGNTCGALASSVNQFPNVNNPHFPSGVGVIGFGDAWGVAGWSAAEIQATGGNVDGAGIPFTVDYGVVGAAVKGPGVFGVSGTPPAVPNLQVGSTGVMGVSGPAPGVTGVSVASFGVEGLSGNVGVAGLNPNNTSEADIADNIKKVGTLGVSDNIGVLGIASNNTGLVNPVNNLHGIGVLGGSDGVGVMGVSTKDRGGVFQSDALGTKQTAQVRLVPLIVHRGWTPKQLPGDGLTGDLIAVQISAIDVAVPCALYFCTQGHSLLHPVARWAQVMLQPV